MAISLIDPSLISAVAFRLSRLQRVLGFVSSPQLIVSTALIRLVDCADLHQKLLRQIIGWMGTAVCRKTPTPFRQAPQRSVELPILDQRQLAMLRATVRFRVKSRATS